ncbi:hypothetical protein DM02DRAFT_672959 [Periconia macrospinosa]|uniref:Glutamyl-tRNA(Gln) amidotransferase subunit B, mitochondrial n=1 Tax=Periconia macrospinosa TaxID=97972 RepID=A0A2V1DP74_9PLEO|nr:hypothetical protein DM02DRAFT_672959 [Periconia macrospinosa]
MIPSTTRTTLAAASIRPSTHHSCRCYTSCLPLIKRKIYDRPLFRLLHTARESLKDDTPFRKALKDAAKKDKKEKREHLNRPSNPAKLRGPHVDNWELTVGIEIHAELNTVQKLFSGAATSVNQAPNTHVALFDMAFPGSQPHFQTQTLIPALRAALALNCDIQYRSSFDRKHYFYQDQPTGYQITQYYEPFARDGYITLYPHDFPPGSAHPNEPVTIGIKQVQMEQDTAKTIQQPPSTHLLDFNRVSHPLIEIITLPQIHDPTTAAVCVRKIQAILKAVNAATAGMELGGLRADVNVSIRPRDKQLTDYQHSYSGVTGLGQRTEIKNLASLKAVEDAIIAERDRQIELLEGGGVVEGETRGWTLGNKSTKRLRGKEGEIDYRYMPDPDIPPIFVDPELVDHLRSTLPRLSDESVHILTNGNQYNLTPKDASTLLALDDGERLDYYYDVVERLRARFAAEPAMEARIGKSAGNWVLMELGGLVRNEEWSSTRVPSEQLASIISHVLRKTITGRTAKTLLSMKYDGDERPVDQIIADENMLVRPLSDREYEELAKGLLEEKADMVRDIVEKNQFKKVKWFVGQMMARSAEGTVEPDKAEEVLRTLLPLPREN